MLNNFFRGIFDTEATAVISVTDFMMCVICSLVIGLILAVTFMYKSRYSKSFVLTLALLPAIVCIVIMMVNGNIGTGVAVAGAFSLVRFRSAPGTAKEIGSLFIAMSAGLIGGMGYLAYAVLFTMIMCIMLFLYNQTGFGKNKNDYKAVKFATLVYASVFLAAFLLRYLVKTNILYYRYLFVITGLYIFVLSDIRAKSKNKYILGLIITITIVLGTANNIIQIQDNYAKGNIDEIKYLQENIQKDDVIVYSNIGNGSIIASNFLDNKQYFYNGADWGVEEAYKCWAPQMETWITTDFLQYCTGRVWIIDSQDNGFYDELFNNDDFKFISTKTFEQKYQNYIYNITLVERVK